MKIRKAFMFTLALVLIIGLFPMTASARTLQVVDDGSDTLVYAGGIYDLKVKAIGAEGRVTYNWQLGLGNGTKGWKYDWTSISAHLSDWTYFYFDSELPNHLMNNLRMTTDRFGDGGEDKDADWHEIQFRCVATDEAGNSGTSQEYHMYVYSYDAMKKRVEQENAFQMLTEPENTQITREVGQGVDFTIHTNDFPEWMTDSEVAVDQYFEIIDGSGTHKTKGDGGFHYGFSRGTPCTVKVISHADLYCGPNLIASRSKTYNVTFTPKEEDPVPKTYGISVSNGYANKSSAAAGETVTISYTGPSSIIKNESTEFDHWEVASGGAALTDPKAKVTNFVMPEANVVINGVYRNKEGSGEPAKTNPFVDVSESDYFYEPVLWAVAQGITKGMDDTHFSPYDSCTRGQVVTFLWRAAGSPEPSGSGTSFTDVSPSDYFAKAVSWAVEKGITNGLSDKEFGPDVTCTRGQVVTFLHRAKGSPATSGSVNPFTDVSSSDYFYKPVLWAVEKGITKGMTDTTFGPNDSCDRGQVVTFLYRAYK